MIRVHSAGLIENWTCPVQAVSGTLETSGTSSPQMAETLGILIVVAAIMYPFWLLASRPARKDRQKFAATKAWARSKGYELPRRPGAGANILILVGLVLGIIPGIVIWAVVKRKRDSYEREMRDMKNKWIDAGSPAPLPPAD